MKTADENLALVAQPGNRIEGLEDDGARALRGAKETGLGLIEQLQWASGPELSGRVAAQPLKQNLRIGWTFLANCYDLFVEDRHYFPSTIERRCQGHGTSSSFGFVTEVFHIL